MVTAAVTTANGSALLSPLQIRRVDGSAASQVVLAVRPAERYQKIVGFGASITESSAVLLRSLSDGNRAALMAELFSPSGLRLSVLRQPIGGSEFVAAGHYTLDDTDGSPDPDLRGFTIRRDQLSVLPLVRAAQELSGSITVIGSPWSAPAWMKTDGSLIGGSLRATVETEYAYARYLARFVAAYRSQGVPVGYITVQNEPAHATWDYPGMVMSSDQQSRVIRMVAALLSTQGSDTGILGWDHNWSGGAGFVDELLAGPAAGSLGGIAYHCYAGSPRMMTEVAGRTAGGVFHTECSGSYSVGDSPKKRFSDTLQWQARNLLIGAVKAGSRTVVTWNLALDPTGGPRLGGCATCTGVVTVDPATGTVMRNAEYYVLGHLSRYVVPGAVRIGVSRSGDSAIDAVAFANPDGSTALVLNSGSREARTVTVKLGDQQYQMKVRPRSLVSVALS